MADETLTAASSPVPTASIVPTPAPGLQGPRGLSPRQNYSRVNTGVPEGSDAGALQQKSIMPKVGSVMSISMATRPRALNDMLKTAMESALGRAKIAEEAKRQLANLEGGDDKDDEKGDKKEKDGCMKTSSAVVLPTDYVFKLAAASDYIVELLKEGADLAGPYTLTENITGAGLGPQALKVTPTEPWGPDYAISGSTGQAGVNKPPGNPGMQKARPQEYGATQMENDWERAPGAGDPPVSGSTKNAAPIGLLRKMAEGIDPNELAAMQAAGETPPNMPPLTQRFGNWVGRNWGTLSAVSGGLSGAALGAVPAVTYRLLAKDPKLLPTVGLSAAVPIGAGLGALMGRGLGRIEQGVVQGMAGGAAPYPNQGADPGLVPSKTAGAPIHLLRKMAEDATNPARIEAGGEASTRMPVSSAGEAGPPAAGKGRVPTTAEGVATFTRRDAKSVPKAEMKGVLDEPMDSEEHDNVLQQAFSHTDEAGAKISSAHNVKLAAARALLQNLASGGR